MRNKKLYICVTPFFPSPESVFGAYVYDQVKAIERNSDYEVVVFRPKSLRDKRTSYEYGGIKVYLFHALFMPSYFLNGLTNPYNGRAFLTALREHGISVDDIAAVHCHTASFASFGLAVKRRNRGVKYVVQHHDLDPYQIRNGKLAGWLPNLLFRAKVNMRIFGKADCHICVSGAVEKNLLTFPKVDEDMVYEPYTEKLRKIEWLRNDTKGWKTYVLYNGVDTQAFRPLPSPPRDVFAIGCIANYQELKGHITLLEAASILKDKGVMPRFQVRLIGHGPMEDSLRKYVAEHGLQEEVRFEREISHSELPAFYNALDLFVLPSYFEGFGCVYTEAAACGVPFMMCKGQGAAEYIPEPDADKWLIDRGDSEALADKISRYYTHRYEQKLSKTFDIDELVREYLRTVID